MTTLADIQRRVGVKPDNVWGPKTADAIMNALPTIPLPDLPPSPTVTGKGVNITRVFIHCSATREGQDIDAATIRKWHLAQGWKDIGYHFVIRLDGSIERGRPENTTGSHVAGFNTGSIGVVYVGGLDTQGKPKDTRTPAQLLAMRHLCKALASEYPKARFMGHRDASPDKDRDGVIEKHEWLKECPCFDVKSWWESVR